MMSCLILLLFVSNLFFIESFTYNVRSVLRKTQFKMTASSESDDKLYTTLGATGLVANAICDYSLYVLKTTGCGLPAGPFGLVGAAEGVSYLSVVGILGWSLFTKVKTGSGLPAGPGGVLGAAEGITFLTILGGIVIAGLNLADYGFLPGFLPNERCG